MEANADGLGHAERHGTSGGSEGNETTSGREGDTDGETSVGVTTSTNGVREEHAVEPGVDDTVTRAEGDTTTVADEVREGVVGHDVNRLRVGGGVAEGLHDKVSLETEAGKILELITGHGSGGILGTDGGHEGLTVVVGKNTRETAGLTDHLLGKGVALVLLSLDVAVDAEDVRGLHAKALAGLGGETTANDERDTATSLDLVKENLGRDLELGEFLTRLVVEDLALIGEDVDHLAHLELGHIKLNGEGSGVLSSVEENGSNLATKDDTTGALVGHVGDVITHVPEHAVDGTLTGGTGTDDITNVGKGESGLLALLDLSHSVLNALTGVLEHSLSVEGDIRAGPSIRGRGEIIGVSLTGHEEDGHTNLLGDRVALEEPLSLGPGLKDLLGLGVAGLGLLLNVVKGVEDKESVLEGISGNRGKLGVVKEVDEGSDVVATLHGSEKLGGVLAVDKGALGLALGDSSEEGSLYVSGLIDTGGDTALEKLNKLLLLALLGALELGDEVAHLLSVKGAGHNTLGLTLLDVLLVGVHEGGELAGGDHLHGGGVAGDGSALHVAGHTGTAGEDRAAKHFARRLWFYLTR
mmetsp:Transcript_4487/g.9608  ORF Transcript_4487/g.9608 Transcript_4487/m.9608 type:complete len:582 (-) Transcript_4487:123-1868(-)